MDTSIFDKAEREGKLVISLQKLAVSDSWIIKETDDDFHVSFYMIKNIKDDGISIWLHAPLLLVNKGRSMTNFLVNDEEAFSKKIDEQIEKITASWKEHSDKSKVCYTYDLSMLETPTMFLGTTYIYQNKDHKINLEDYKITQESIRFLGNFVDKHLGRVSRPLRTSVDVKMDTDIFKADVYYVKSSRRNLQYFCFETIYFKVDAKINNEKELFDVLNEYGYDDEFFCVTMEKGIAISATSISGGPGDSITKHIVRYYERT